MGLNSRGVQRVASRAPPSNAMRYPSGVTVDERIGENVHHMMWKRHMTVTAASAEMGISKATLSRKLRGDVVWLARDIEAVARILEVDPGRLFVAGAGFEPATSGSPEPLADVVRLHPDGLTKDDVALIA